MPPKTINTPGTLEEKIMPLPTSHSGAMHTSVGTDLRLYSIPSSAQWSILSVKIYISTVNIIILKSNIFFEIGSTLYFCQGQWFTENCSARPKLFWSDTPDFHTKCLRATLIYINYTEFLFDGVGVNMNLVCNIGI